jgi:predicted short-subunit dehydrogenase-like oxidoreductase (DUF2520 family)
MLDPTIIILGNGNVAAHLSEALLNAGYSVLQLWKRGEVLRDADLYFIAVSDDAIEEVSKLIPENKFFAHTSGNIELKRGSVFYPLQTFSKYVEMDWTNIPILVESDDENLEQILVEIAKKISTNVQVVDAKTRRQIHLAAVFACNFTNHLWTISEDLLNEKNLPFDLLKPLINQTVQKIQSHHPKDVQTGPATRNDLKTLENHRKILSKLLNESEKGQASPAPTGNCTGAVYAPLLEIYNILSKSIHNYGSH